MTPYMNGQPKVLYSLGRCVPGGRLRPCHTRLPHAPRPNAPPRPGPVLLWVVGAGRSGGAAAPVLSRRCRCLKKETTVSVRGLRGRGQGLPDGHGRRPSWRRQRPLAWPGGGTDLAPGTLRPCGAGRGRSVLGSLAQNLSFIFPQLDANSLTKPGKCATSTLMDNKVVFMPGGGGGAPTPPEVIMLQSPSTKIRRATSFVPLKE